MIDVQVIPRRGNAEGSTETDSGGHGMVDVTCVVDECGNAPRGRGTYCEKHRQRLQKHGSLDDTEASLARERTSAALALGVRGTNTGPCVLWPGALNPHGYGISGGGLAHRRAWRLANGEIPEGLFVCHACDVRQCVNVGHLFLGTAAENSTDMKNKGRSPRLANEASGRAKLSNAQVEEIRTRVALGETCKAVALAFGCHTSHVSRIVNERRRPIESS